MDINTNSGLELEKCCICTVNQGDKIYCEGMSFEVEEIQPNGNFVRLYINGRWRSFPNRKIIFVKRRINE